METINIRSKWYITTNKHITTEFFLKQIPINEHFFEIGVPIWRIVFKFKSDIGDKGFKQGPDIFGREGTHNLVSANISSGINMLYVMTI